MQKIRHKTGASEALLVSTFPTGCRPRYTCIQILKRSNFGFYVKLSASQTWPFISSSEDPIDCRSFTFDIFSEIAGSASKFISKYFRFVYSKENIRPVHCHLPVDMPASYFVMFNDDSRCVGQLVKWEPPPIDGDHAREPGKPDSLRPGTGFDIILSGCNGTSSNSPKLCMLGIERCVALQRTISSDSDSVTTTT